jgi:hypothetical protein
MSYADVGRVRRRGGEVTGQQVGHLRSGRISHGGAHPPSAPVAGDPRGAHHPGHPLVVDPLGIGGAVVELSGDPRRTVGVVLGVHRPDTRLQILVSGGFGGPGIGGGQPGVERPTRDLNDLA